MGKTRDLANLVSENLMASNVIDDKLTVGNQITLQGGAVGTITAAKFVGDGSLLTNLTAASGVSIDPVIMSMIFS
jgi:preprotein translocase subunit YajC